MEIMHVRVRKLESEDVKKRETRKLQVNIRKILRNTLDQCNKAARVNGYNFFRYL